MGAVRAMLCVGLLGSAATVALGPDPAAVTWAACGVFLACLVAVVFRALGRASRRVDAILGDVLTSEKSPADEPSPELRKTA